MLNPFVLFDGLKRRHTFYRISNSHALKLNDFFNSFEMKYSVGDAIPKEDVQQYLLNYAIQSIGVALSDVKQRKLTINESEHAELYSLIHGLKLQD